MKIVQTSAGQRFMVKPAGEGLDHCWSGIEVKRGARGSGIMWAAKARARHHLIRKDGCKVIWSDEQEMERRMGA
jgi:hypothetical protein